MGIVNIIGLQEEAKKRQAELRYLPYLMLMTVLNELGINLKTIKGIDVIQEIQRKGNLLRPYVIGNSVAHAAELMKVQERDLRLYKSYISMIDDINNYSTAPIAQNPFDSGQINQTKKHPLEFLIIQEKIKTFAEDVLMAVGFGQRDNAGTEAIDTFNGIHTIIDDEVVGGALSVANGNIVNTGAITGPSGETDYAALTKLIAFIRSADPMLRAFPSNLYMANDLYTKFIDALENRKRYKDADVNSLETYINEKCQSKITIKKHIILGSGDRMILTIPGIFDMGFDSFSDADFVEVRKPYENPNIVQFWMQADMNMRLNGTHKKVICINDRTNTSNFTSGDYQS